MAKAGKSVVPGKNVRTTWVLVMSPDGVPEGTVVGVDAKAATRKTGAVFRVDVGLHTFRVEHAGLAWSARLECAPARPRTKPQTIKLAPEQAKPLAEPQHPSSRPLLAGSNRAVVRSDRDTQLVAGAGRRPGAQTVVYVHGIGNKPDPSVLECQWDAALFGKPMGDRTRMAYWVNRDRYPSPLSATCNQPDRTATEDDEATTATIMALAAVAAPATGPGREAVALDREIAALGRDDDERTRLRLIADQIDRDAVEEDPPPPPTAQPGRASIRIFPFSRPVRQTLARLFTRVLLRDVDDFLFDELKRKQMTDALWERLRGGGEPFVIIAHSQGSMVAYDLLRRLRREDCEVALLVTIGSPLGLQEVKDHFTEDGMPPTTPACVGKWVYIADRLDPVALDPTLRGEYGPNARGVEVEDAAEWWLNPDSPRDPHSATGYLQTAQVRDAVRRATGNAFAQPVSRSVISRDVAATSADSGGLGTQDVLIQLADPDDAEEPRALVEVADTLVERLRSLAEKRSDDAPVFEEPDRLKRFVQAKLTASEIESLRTLSAELRVKQVWSNARKRTMIHASAGTVQATAGNLGYDAMGRGIGWAVLDTGIDTHHPHFQLHGNVREQWDCLEPGEPTKLLRKSDDATSEDENGHGTHVAAVIAGRVRRLRIGSREGPVAGMAPETTLYGFRVLNERGEGTDATIIKALDKIAEINERSSALVIHGVNLSLGSNFDPRIYGVGHTPLCQELRRLWRQGVLVCVAAGNEGYAELQASSGTFGANLALSIGDPANLEEAIAVGSVHKSKPHTYGTSFFSSRGPTADGRRKPDVVAPGEKILSARAGAVDMAALLPADAVLQAEEYYVEMSGTSMATPHVSGVLAAFLSARREFIGEPDRVKGILIAACTDLGRDPNMQGAGLVNLVKMLVAT